MNHDNREQRWQAYLDGELSACEAAQFEATLSEAERRQLSAEKRFDRALADRLRQDADCPDAVWARTRAKIAPDTKATTRRRLLFAGAALAAALAVFVLPELYPLGLAGVTGKDVIHAAASVEDLIAQSDTEPGLANVQHYMDGKGIALDLETDSELFRGGPGHTPGKVLGVRQGRFAGTRVTEVFVDCCGRPVKFVLAPRGSRAARVLVAAMSQPGHVQATREVGDYVVAAVSRHPADRLLDLFEAQAV